MIVLVARRGRELQRYSSQGHRLVVGCIPYKLKVENLYNLVKEEIAEVLKVMIIRSQNGHEIMFPKGRWESDETIERAASREAVEKAGVIGVIEVTLGKWAFKSKTEDSCKVGFMFLLRVTEELEDWLDINSGRRRWATVEEVKNSCNEQWMEALDRLIERLSAPSSSWCEVKAALKESSHLHHRDFAKQNQDNPRKGCDNARVSRACLILS